MTIQLKSIVIIAVLLALSLCLAAQSEKPASSSAKANENEVKQIFNMLLDADFTAEGFILWDDFYLNDEDITYYYYDALDYGDNDLFTKEIVAEISTLLHYDGDEGDAFKDWTFEPSEEDLYVTCMNKKKSVEMWFYTPVDDHLYLREAFVTDKK